MNPDAGAKPTGRVYIILALTLFAASSVLDKLLVSTMRVNPWTVLFYQQCVYVLVFGGYLSTKDVPVRALARQARALVPVIAIIAILTIGYRYLQLEATRLAPVALVLAVKRSSVLFASVIGGTLFSDHRLVQRIVGAVLIVAAGFIMLRSLAG